MPKFGTVSKNRLASCHPDLQRLFNKVIKIFDCSILEGYRGKEAQETAYREKRSKKRYPMSKHNKKPSVAVDVAPYPIDWDDLPRFNYFAGIVHGIATSMDINIRWGGDWDGDTQLIDNKFDDLLHFELIRNA